jgi:VWFA-related protein
VGGGTALYDAVDEGLQEIRHGVHTRKAMLLISDGEDTQSGISFDDALLAVRESEFLVYCLGISPASSGPMRTQIPLPGTPPIVIGPGGSRIPFPQPGGGGGRSRIPQQRPDTVDMRVLNAFADASGGRAWLLSGTWSDSRGNQIEAALDEIAAELRNQYSIGYYPGHSMDDGKWHRIEIRLKNSRYRVRYRQDYFGGQAAR